MQHTISNEIFAGTVGFYNRFNEIFRNICVVSQKLLCVLGQAVTTIAERRIIVLVTNSRIKAYTLNDLLSVQALHFGVGIQLIEIADAQSQIGIGEQLDGLCLSKAHNQGVDALFNSAFLE